jgi:uncharacterized membrane protein YgdD (TMEM256/DUF423 family)
MDFPLAWERRTWMTLAALTAMGAPAIVVAATLLNSGRAAELLKAGAAVQFMHSMATLACATVIQIGGVRARHAPAYFLISIVLLPGSLYAMAAGIKGVWAVTVAGIVTAAFGWVILAMATRSVDQPHAARPTIGRRSSERRLSPAE